MSDPFDFTGMLGEMIRKSSSGIDGLTADVDKLKKQRDIIDLETPSERGGGFASMVLPFLGGYFGGGGGSEGLSYGGLAAQAGVTNYYNNLEADEKRRKMSIESDINEKVREKQDLINQQQSLEGANLGYLSGMSQAAQTGRIPGTPQFQALINADINKAAAIRGQDQTSQIKMKQLTGEIPYLDNGAINPAFAAKQAETGKTVDPSILANVNRILPDVIPGFTPIGPDASPAQLNTLTNAVSARTGDRSYDMRADKWSQEMANATNVPGLYKNPAVANDPVETAKLRAKFRALVNFEEMAPAIETAIAQGSQLSAEQAEQLRPLFSRWVAAGRALDGTGANLTVPEIKNTFASLAQVLENPNTSWGKMLGDMFRGVDPNKTLRNYVTLLQQEVANDGKMLGFYHPSFRDFYSQEDYQRYAIPPDLAPRQNWAPVQPGAGGAYTGAPTGQPSSSKLETLMSLLGGK
jgi:hypothetical protein